MSKLIFVLVIITLLLYPHRNSAQAGSRRIHNDKNAYRDCYQRMSAGGSHMLEIRSGALWACGNNHYGQLGDGTNVNANTPKQIGTATNWVTISGGANHSLAIRADGTLWAWGQNLYGQVGNSTNTDENSPVQIGSSNKWISISAGKDHSLGIQVDGTLWAWGHNASGQLGDGTDTDRIAPVQIGTASNWVSVSAGYDRSFALQANGTLWVWGDNTYGWLGIGVTADKNVPVQIDLTNNWVNISAGPDHALAIKSNGTLWGWGTNALGQLGDGTTISKTIPEQIGSSNNWVSISSGGFHSAAIQADGTLWTWGGNSHGELGDGDTVKANLPVHITPGSRWVSVVSGGNFTLGLNATGQLSAWGADSSGQLGNANNINQNTPQPVSAVSNWVKISPGANYTLALKSDGSLWAWGQNDAGNFGDSSAEYISKVPVPVGNATWIDISAGQDFSLGIQSDGTLWAWGNNYYGEVGNDTTKANAIVPIKIDSSHNWISIAAGGAHGVALKANGTVWTWGSNYSGQLGRNGGNLIVPGQVGTDSNWIRIAAGTGGANPMAQTLAIKSDGTVWGWGNAIPLGNGTLGNSSTPLQIGTDSNWVAVAAGQGSSYGLRANGTLWAWGGNYYGGLGDGTTNNANSAEQIGAAKNTWIQIAAGSLHALGLEADGEIWSWGYNFSGQLGEGFTGGNQLTPTAVVPATGWGVLGAGCESNSSLAIKPDRLSYCTSGENNLGQLGDGNNIQTNTFNCTSLVTVVKPVAGFTANTTTICSGDSITFTDKSTGTPVSWQWTFTGGTPVNSGAQNPIVTYLSRGTYTVKLVVSNSSGTDSVTKIAYINVNPIPIAGTITGPDSVCTGSTVHLSDTGNIGSIQWQSSSNAISFNNISADTSSGYSVDSIIQTTYYRVKAYGTCGIDTSAILKVTVNPLPVPIVSTPDSLICSGDSSKVCSSGPFASYFWNTTDTATCTIATAGGGYWVTVTDANGCSAVSNHHNISVYPVPSVSIIVQGDTLASFNSNHFQWYFNDSIIPGANSSTYVAGKSGNYAVQVIDSNGCFALSNYTPVVINSLPTFVENNRFNMYPNPFNNTIFIQFEEANSGIEFLSVYDLLGRECIERKFDNKLDQMELDVSALPQGLYYFRVKTSSAEFVRMVVKQ